MTRKLHEVTILKQVDPMTKTFKIIILGDTGVGKTALLNQYVKQTFIQDHKSTVGVDFFFKNIYLHWEKVHLQIWDTAGQERFNSLSSSYFRGAHCCVLVYDCSKKSSFDNLLFWRDKFLKSDTMTFVENFPFVALATNVTLKSTSAKMRFGVDTAFCNIAEIVKEYQEKWEEVDMESLKDFPDFEIQNNKKGFCFC
uniref:Uncharacterized protein n=1 Tax=Megaselia scalaris TaxID=36166 RepID=T1GU88_MEGSC